MNISDIIKSDKDRVFVVDSECFIIFTGDNKEDIRPFIRIGNWINLPVELIPNIENVIITDMMVGNASNEQFNLDVKTLSSNRYIGSRAIVQRYLDFQKIFGLDLKNAIIVDAEKDIPEISKMQNISDRESFIGIFYSDGNFIIKHNNRDLFSLKDWLEDTISDVKINKTIYQNTKNLNRYSGVGFVFMNSNPILYSKNNFISYLFPWNYQKYFGEMEINPSKLQAVLHPSGNYLNLTKILKWFHESKGKIKIFSDHTEDISIIKKLFRNASISSFPFNGLSFNTGSGLELKGVPNSYSFKAVFENKLLDKADEKDKIEVFFIKGSSSIKEILKQKSDGNIVNFSVYEDEVLQFKSTGTPLALIDDGSKNISRINPSEHTVLYNHIQYNLKKTTDIYGLLNEFSSSCSLMDSGPFDKAGTQEFENLLLAHLSGAKIGSDDPLDTYNSLSLIKYFHKSAKNRKLSQLCGELIRKEIANFDIKKITEKYQICSDLILTECGFFDVLKKITHKNDTTVIPDDIIEDKDLPSLYQSTNNDFFNRIENDRKRLYSLLSIFAPHRNKIKDSTEHGVLSEAIEERKNFFIRPITSEKDIKSFKNAKLHNEIQATRKKHKERQINTSDLDNINKNAISQIASSIISTLTGKKKASAPNKYDLNKSNIQSHFSQKDLVLKKIKETLLQEKTFFGKKIIKWKLALLASTIIIIALFILAFFLIYMVDKNEIKIGSNSLNLEQNKPENTTSALQTPDKDTSAVGSSLTPAEKAINDKYGSTVSNYDIFIYVNMVADLNGFDHIPVAQIKKKNPDWIFPGNKIKLPSGGEITVKTGDTLWGISENELYRIYAKFYRIVEEIEKEIKSGTTDMKKVAEAKSLIISKSQQKIFSDLENKIKK